MTRTLYYLEKVSKDVNLSNTILMRINKEKFDIIFKNYITQK